MADSGGDKKHFATDQRRRRARQEGQVVKSQDLTSAGLLLASLASLWWLGGRTCDALGDAMIEYLGRSDLGPIDTGEATARLLRLGAALAVAAGPMLMAMLVAAVAVNITQTGLMVSTAKLVPKLSHLNPLTGVKRIASLQGLMRLMFGLFKVAVILAVAYVSLLRNRDLLLELPSLSVGELASGMFQCLVGTCLWIGGALFVLALLEYAFQKWKFEQDLMMTDQELREEIKETEGDPQVAQRRRQVQRQMAMNRASSEVPKADVVVSNPTELAIAIRYDPASMPAPVVLAKGAGLVAQRIRRIALQHGIPVVERKPLARVLYQSVETGDVVPPEQYQAVAEVLRYVYQLQGKEIPKAA